MVLSVLGWGGVFVVMWRGWSTWIAVVKKMNNQRKKPKMETIVVENRFGNVVQFPLRSVYADDMQTKRKRERAKFFAVSLLVSAAIVLAFLLVAG